MLKKKWIYNIFIFINFQVPHPPLHFGKPSTILSIVACMLSVMVGLYLPSSIGRHYGHAEFGVSIVPLYTTLPLDIIGNLCSVAVTLPGHLLYY